MASRAGGGDWGEEPTANLKLTKAHVIRRSPTPGEKVEQRATQELARLELEALLADPLLARRVSEPHVAIEIVDELPGPIAAASVNFLAFSSAPTPKLGIERIPGGIDLADGSQRLELGSIPSAPQGTGAVVAIGPAVVELGFGTDSMSAFERPFERAPEPQDAQDTLPQRGPWSDLAIGFGFGATLLAIAVLLAMYAL